MSGPTYIDIDVHQNLSSASFNNEYLEPERPVVIRGGAATTRAVETWSPRWFAQTYPLVSVPIAVGPRRKILEHRIMRISDYVAAMHDSDGSMYLRQFDIFRIVPDLLADLPDPIYCPSDRQLIRNFWMGANTVQPLHQDSIWPIIGICNLFIQIYGRKRVTLAAPNQTSFLYKHSSEDADPHLSRVDIEAPDLTRFPLLQSAKLWRAEVEGGDLLFIPTNYWHSLQAFGDSISVSLWWHPHWVSALIHGVVKLARDDRDTEGALRLARDHAGSVRFNDVEALGGTSLLAAALRTLPGWVSDAVKLVFDEDVRAALQVSDK